MPVPKMFKGMQGQKGQWRMEMLEGGSAASAAKAPVMTMCTDNLMKPPAGRDAARAESGCKHRLIKDTPNEAVMEIACPERTSTVTMTREGAKSMLMSVTSTGPRGPQSMKMRYTHLGPCREGQPTMTLDKNSEQCQKVRAQAAKMDPKKSCAGLKSDREQCEQRIRESVAQMTAMCS